MLFSFGLGKKPQANIQYSHSLYRPITMRRIIICIKILSRLLIELWNSYGTQVPVPSEHHWMASWTCSEAAHLHPLTRNPLGDPGLVEGCGVACAGALRALLAGWSAERWARFLLDSGWSYHCRGHEQFMVLRCPEQQDSH